MRGLYRPIAEHLHKFCKEGDFVIWRDAFRWKRYNHNPPNVPYEMYCNNTIENTEDTVLSNHYDGMSLEQLAEDFGYEIDWETDMHHAAIVRKTK